VKPDGQVSIPDRTMGNFSWGRISL